MGVLFSGIIGAAAATAAWLSAEHFAQMNLGWLVCLIGVVTGLCVRWASGANAKASFLRGALAIALTLIGIVAGRQVYVKVMQAKAADAGAPAALSVAQADAQDDAGEAAEATAVEDEAVETEQEQPSYQLGKPKIQKPSLKNTFSELDILWMSLAALAAYVLGKETGGSSSVSSEQEPEAAEPAPENSDE